VISYFCEALSLQLGSPQMLHHPSRLPGAHCPVGPFWVDRSSFFLQPGHSVLLIPGLAAHPGR
jgi:hypothetical protein